MPVQPARFRLRLPPYPVQFRRSPHNRSCHPGLARLHEQDYFRPPAKFVGQANVSDPAIYDEVGEFPDGFARYAELLDWDERWDRTFDGSNPPFFEWFVGGELNASVNYIDRHPAERKNQTALLWEGEGGERRNITYRDLYREVNEMTAVLRSVGVEEDDVVTVHLPMVPALPITMLACARIGAPHSVVFVGFSASALAERARDADSDYVVTIDGYYRRGEFLNHVEDLPKTPSGKIMRRLLENISNDDELGDTTTLRDPSVPEDIRRQVRGD